MNKLSIIALHVILSMSSCNPYKKIASDAKRTDAETKLLATICAAEFPPIEYISEGTKTIDSTAYKEAYKALERALQDAGDDVQNLLNLIEQKGQDNDVLRDMLFAAQKKVDSLNAVKQAYKYIPCPDAHTRDTGHLINKAELTALQIKYDQLNRESAAKDLVIDKANASRQEAENKLADAQKARWKLFWIGLGVGAGVVAVGGFILKLKSII